MSGISYLVDEQGQRSAVVIDLEKHGELWEDFHDILLAEERKNEPLETLEEVLQSLRFASEEMQPQ
jgi:hypothetical protein